MMALENLSSLNSDGISFTNLNNSFEAGLIHGIWNETDTVNTGLLQLLTGNIPLISGTIRYNGEQLDHTEVAYYNRADLPGQGLEKQLPLQPCRRKLVYLFDDIFDPADITAAVRFYKIILPLKQMGRTILITSTDYKALRVPTDFFHIFSKGAFQAKLHSRQYNLLDDVFRHLQRRS